MEHEHNSSPTFDPKVYFAKMLESERTFREIKKLTVVYVFAGHRRRADVREHLQRFADLHGITLRMREFDILMDERHDVLDEAFWNELVTFIHELKPDCVVVTPPCSTYSRARHFYKQSPGPRPIRSRQHPLGFPWLSHKNRVKAEQGTKLADKAWELLQIFSDIGAMFLSEFPEDLGLTSTGVPPSFWQMQQCQDMLALAGVITFALFQCEFGAATPKPTRFITSLKHFDGNIYMGTPRFDDQWRYLGPLPPCCPHPHAHEALTGMSDDGGWKTAPAAHYPGPLCELLAQAIWKTWHESSASGGCDVDINGCPSDSAVFDGEVVEDFSLRLDTEEHADMVHSGTDSVSLDHSGTDIDHSGTVVIQSGCAGPPLVASHAGRSEEFCDGLGLCSAGRWRPAMRQVLKNAEQLGWCQRFRELLDRFCTKQIPDLAKATFALALGKCNASIFDRVALEALRSEWFNLLPDPRSAAVLEPDQPFYLHALAQSLRLVGDPDVDILDTDESSCFTKGVHLGHIHQLGPTPQVFRAKIKETVYDQSDWTLEMNNYFSGSEEEASKILQQQFEEEEAASRMKPISTAEARRQYPGDSLRIAAQGILEKPDGSYRVVHDGIHGVHLNNQIRIADKMDNPGPREMACVMETSLSAGERVIFAVNGDVSKAHRRVRVKQQDWGVQAARTDRNSNTVWLNKVGTFGVASAAFWWSRLMGLIGRFALATCMKDWIFILTFVDDLHMAFGGTNRWLTFWRLMACLEMVGIPFSYKKFVGGFQLDYVGFWIIHASNWACQRNELCGL